MFSQTVLLLLSVSSTFAATCSSAAGWADSDRTAIVNAHNTLKSKIAKGTYVAKGGAKPAGKDLVKVSYDCSLETSAQSWADSCKMSHSGMTGKGENMYFSWSTAPLSITGKGAAACASWEKEFQDYGWTNNTFTMSNLNIGHATQMAWAATNRVGCGVKLCPSSMSQYPYQVTVVCQYTTQGNIISKNIYTSGTVCSACPTGTKCETATGLCA